METVKIVQILSRPRKPNLPLLGYGKTNDYEMDKERGWENNVGERREGDKGTKGIMEKRAMFFPVIFGGSGAVYNNVQGKITKYTWES
jgi:hypothetical protein